MTLFRRSIRPEVHAIAQKLVREKALAAARVVPLADVKAVNEGELDPLTGDATDWVVATKRYVIVVRDGVATGRPWCDVDRATLDPLTANLTLFWADGSPMSELRLADEQDPKLASVLHERVQASVVLAETVRVPGGPAVRVAVRRNQHGNLFSQVVGPGNVPLDDPETVALIDAAEASLRDACGLPQ